jgi:hypothetical protein
MRDVVRFATENPMQGLRAPLLMLLLVSASISGAQQTSPEPLQPQKQTTLLEAIASTGVRMHVPLGIVIGENGTALCKRTTHWPSSDLTAREAVEQLAGLAQYAVEEHDGVLTLIAPDITAHQRDLLTYRAERFELPPKRSMRILSSDMTGWLWMFADGGGGYGTSVGDGVGSYAISLPPMDNVTTEQIANRAMKMEPGGIWILRASAGAAKNSADDRIDFYSYAEPDRIPGELGCDPGSNK